MSTHPVRYRITPVQPEAHLFEVTCTIADPDPDGQQLSLPVWIPGSYLIREFARNVVSIQAATRAGKVAVRKIDKSTWRCAPVTGRLVITVTVYAHDLSVRSAHLDRSHGFFNGTSVFLRVHGQEHLPCEVDIRRPAGTAYRAWQVATAMPRLDAPAYGFGLYGAADYDALIDHPVEMGTFARTSFRAHGVPHDVVITGRQDADLDRLARDLKRLCEAQIDLFGRPAPMKYYLFLVTALGEGYSGLEHRASTALLCGRDDLPQRGAKDMGDRYRGFLGLCSHEYFHTWNVKRIKPAAFAPYDLRQESYTRLLWAMEGITSYYDDLMLVRCGLIDESGYAELLGRAITTHFRTGGRLVQTVEEASFDAWIKYYRQDENSPNALVSYYLKGSLVALCLDLMIRQRTRGRKSLDDVMRILWERHGRTGVGLDEDAVERIASDIAGTSLKRYFELALRSTDELPLTALMAHAGLDLHLRAATGSSDKGGLSSKQGSKPAPLTLGARTTEDATGVKLTHVLTNGAAMAAGLSAGDVMVALDGLRVTARNLEQRLSRYTPASQISVHFFRRDELHTTTLSPRSAPIDTADLGLRNDAASKRRRHAWLRR
ncbi:MAG: M61 family metallopeptidase [Betaproteobacteria bacterium]|nr:M61 family metallopeptidase [Betaproteobacteria bacterium]